MSRRTRGGLSPSLFPFLAVLICTLGTLILLLALVAQDATDSATQAAKAEQAEVERMAADPAPASSPRRLAAKTVASMIDEEKFRVEQLIAFRDQQTVDLEQRRDQMTHLEDHVTRLKEKLKRLSDEVDHAMGAAPVQPVDQTTLAAFRTKIQHERDAIEKLKSGTEHQQPRVVIVPHKGPNGTDRRPIYLECDRDGLTIWPEGSRITTRQLEDSDTAANPLDASLRVIRHHAMQRYGDTAPPYPLLVVRPGGIDTYAAAMGAMEDWDDQFGYELVPAETKLAFTVPDSNLKQRIDGAIAGAIANQTAHTIANIGAGLSRGRRPRVLSAASLDQQGRTSGYRATRGQEDYGEWKYGRSSYASGAAGSGAAGSDSDYSRSYSSGNAYGGHSAQSNDPSAIDAATEKRWVDDMRSAAKELRGSGMDNLAGGFAGDANTPMLSGDPQGDTANEDSLAGHRDGPAGDRGHATETSPDDRGIDNSGSEKSLDDLRGSTAAHSAENRSGEQSHQSGTQNSASTMPAAGSSPSAASSSLSSSNVMSQAKPGDSANPDPSAQASPQVSMNMTPQRELVRRQGRDWGLPPEIAGSHGNAIVRTIRVQCYQDRFVLLPSRSGATEMFGFSGGDVNRATIELASAVRDRVALWGVALPGGRWQPRLDVEVIPGGEARFQQLRSLMVGSGVDVFQRTVR